MKIFVGLPAFRSLLCAEQMSTWFSFGSEVALSGLFTAARVEHVDKPSVDLARNLLTKTAIDWGAN